jgi:hypothetical protein
MFLPDAVGARARNGGVAEDGGLELKGADSISRRSCQRAAARSPAGWQAGQSRW